MRSQFLSYFVNINSVSFEFGELLSSTNNHHHQTSSSKSDKQPPKEEEESDKQQPPREDKDQKRRLTDVVCVDGDYQIELEAGFSGFCHILSSTCHLYSSTCHFFSLIRCDIKWCDICRRE